MSKKSNYADETLISEFEYKYDTNGNTLTSGTKTFTYDLKNRQSTFTDGDTTANYTYYPSGLRKNKTVNGETTNFVWDDTLMVYEFGEDETDGDKFTYGLRPIKKNSQYYSCNAHGDVVELVEDEELVRN